MNLEFLDICFCAEEVCPFGLRCARNLKNYPEKETEYVTVTKFEHTMINCDYFMEKGERK